MLVLQRMDGQRTFITHKPTGQLIELVTWSGSSLGGKPRIKLGIEASTDFEILREEAIVKTPAKGVG
jgi:sRNA-binding carbon storage regulator CsrA